MCHKALLLDENVVLGTKMWSAAQGESVCQASGEPFLLREHTSGVSKPCAHREVGLMLFWFRFGYLLGCAFRAAGTGAAWRQEVFSVPQSWELRLGFSSKALVQGYNRCANEVSAFSRSSASRALLSWICMTLKLVRDSFFFFQSLW